jgi:hypothetical protein
MDLIWEPETPGGLRLSMAFKPISSSATGDDMVNEDFPRQDFGMVRAQMYVNVVLVVVVVVPLGRREAHRSCLHCPRCHKVLDGDVSRRNCCDHGFTVQPSAPDPDPRLVSRA